MADISTKTGVQIEVTLFGVIPKQAPLRKYALGRVHDLVDVIHNLESRHSFLNKIKYQVNVNDLLVDKNQPLSSGDRIVIQPKTNARI
jgi:molybdopterin converting factor small subunit